MVYPDIGCEVVSDCRLVAMLGLLGEMIYLSYMYIYVTVI